MTAHVRLERRLASVASLDAILATKEFGIRDALVLCNGNVSQSADGKFCYLPVYALMLFSHDGMPADTSFDVSLPTEQDRIW